MADPVLDLKAGFPVGGGAGFYGVSVYGDGSLYADEVLHDISSRGRTSGWTINRGVQSIVTTGFVADAGSYSVRLGNEDRALDPNHLTGLYTQSGVTAVLPGVSIIKQATYSAVTYPLFAGKANDWPQFYPSIGVDQTVDLMANDATTVFTGANLAIARSAELSGTRIQAIIDAVGYKGPTSIAPGQTLVGPLAFSTVSAWSHMQDVVNSEIGDLYFSADGTLTFRDHDQINSDTRSSVSQATFGDQGVELRFSDVQMGSPPIVNDVTVRYTDQGAEVREQDFQSQNLPHRIKSLTIALPLRSAAVARSYAQHIIARYAYPAPTFASITIKPKRSPATLWPQVLGRELGDRITIKRTPQGGGSRVIKDCYIRGIQHQAADTAWTTTFYLQDATFSQDIGIYGVSIYGGGDVYGL